MSKIDKIEELQNILKEDQTNFQARRELAVLLLDLGYSEEAKQHFLYLSKIFNDDSGIFYNLGITYEKLKNLDVSKFKTQNVTNMQEMFAACYELTYLDVDEFDTSNVTNMYCMFTYCRKLENLDVSGFNTSNVETMYSMFYECSKLTNIDVSRWNTSKVTNMIQMFGYCYEITSLDLSSFDISNVTDMEYMFKNSNKLTVIYVGPKWVIKEGTNIKGMFESCGTSSVTVKTTTKTKLKEKCLKNIEMVLRLIEK